MTKLYLTRKTLKLFVKFKWYLESYAYRRVRCRVRLYVNPKSKIAGFIKFTGASIAFVIVTFLILTLIIVR